MSRRADHPPLERLARIPTPALVVDMAVARRNHASACARLGPAQILRPHFKAHKSLALARLQLAEGVDSVCCQTSWEALALAEAGFGDIMLTNQLVDAAALDELARAATLARVSVLVDHMVHVERLQSAAQRAGVRIDVLIEIEIGMRRCGVEPASADLLTIAAAISASPNLGFSGIQAYDGHVAGIADPAARRLGAARSAELTRQAVGRLADAGFAVPVVAGCGTGHLPFVRELDVWTDIQAGSYLLMDGAYGDCADLDFDVGLFALASVIHRSPGRAVLDVGLKHLAVDRGNPAWIGDPAAVLRLSDEHTVIALDDSYPLAIGDRTFIVPRHIDPTINLHPALWLYDDGVVAAHPVAGRMPARPMAAASDSRDYPPPA